MDWNAVVLTEKCGTWDECAEKAPTSHCCCVLIMRGASVRVCNATAVFFVRRPVGWCWRGVVLTLERPTRMRCMTYSPRRRRLAPIHRSLWYGAGEQMTPPSQKLAAESAPHLLAHFVGNNISTRSVHAPASLTLSSSYFS